MQKTSVRLVVWAGIVAIVLLLPLLAMQFGWKVIDPGRPVPEEVAWGLEDFVFAGAVLYGAGLVYILATRNSRKNRLAIGIAVILVLAFVWVAAATGFERFFN